MKLGLSCKGNNIDILEVFQNMLKMKICGPMKEKLTRYCRKLHSDGVNDFVLVRYYSGNQMRTEETGGQNDTYGREGKCMQNFCG